MVQLKRKQKLHGFIYLYVMKIALHREKQEQWDVTEYPWRSFNTKHIEQSGLTLKEPLWDSIPTFSSFRGVLWVGGAVGLLLLRDSCPLLIKGHWAVLWQAVELLFKLLLQFPKSNEHSSEFYIKQRLTSNTNQDAEKSCPAKLFVNNVGTLKSNHAAFTVT